MKGVKYIAILFLLQLFGCIEPFSIEEELGESTEITDLLVVEGALTNELKRHTVTLKRGSSFAEDGITVVENAVIRVLDNTGNEFSFVESEPATYSSENPFQALADREYTLEIAVGGQTYRSTSMGLPPPASVVNLTAQRLTTDLGIEGVGIFATAELEQGGPPFLRFQYEETFKIIAPLWSPFDMVVLDPNPPYDFGLEPREQEERVCYGTQFSNTIIQSEGIALTGDRLENILVRFIPRDDYIISHRYSILVKQLRQTADAFAFYQTLNELSGSDNVFSQLQPGFIEGNIKNINDADEKVIGYFEVANHSEARLFFNYDDLFPDEDLPPYAISCSFLSAPPTITPAGTSPLKDIIESGEFIYVRETFGTVEDGGPYFVARRACGDCTALGSNIVPDFWEEE